MDEKDFEGTLVLEKLARIDKVAELMDAIDSDDFDRAEALMRIAGVDAPAIAIIEKLLQQGATVAGYDPEAMEEARRIFAARIEHCANNYACLEGADALLLITEWQAFRNPSFERMKSSMRQPVLFDGRNIYDTVHLREQGFTYYGIGRP